MSLLPRPRVVVVAVLALCQMACSDGAVVNLGQKPEPVVPVEPPSRAGFGPPEMLGFSAGEDENPTLDREMRTMYFNRGGTVAQADPTQSFHNVYVVHWDTTTQQFGVPEPVTITTPAAEEPDAIVKYNGGAAISLDGQRLWLAYQYLDDATTDDATTNIDVVRVGPSASEFTFERRVNELNTVDHDERPRPLGEQGNVMPLSRRSVIDDSWTTVFVRCEIGGTCDPNGSEPLELSFESDEDVQIEDGFLSEDGLTFVFKGTAMDRPGDLYWTKRASTSGPWELATELPGYINTDLDERDPWLSPDGQTLFFAANREGGQNIYRAAWVDELPETAEGN